MWPPNHILERKEWVWPPNHACHTYVGLSGGNPGGPTNLAEVETAPLQAATYEIGSTGAVGALA